MSDFNNISLTVACPSVKPFLYTENNKVKSGFKELEKIMIEFPTSTK